MANEKSLKNVQNVFNTLCEMLDDKQFKYKKDEDNLSVTFFVGGEDIPMSFMLSVDAQREVIILMSYIPVTFEADKKTDGAIATCQVNYSLADGSFDYDYESGRVMFRMTSSFKGSLISKELFDYMLNIACYTVDEYNDKFFMLAKGQLDIEEFLKKYTA